MSIELINNVVNQYLNLVPIGTIASQNKIGKLKVKQILKTKNIPLRQSILGLSIRKFNPKQEKDIILLYNSGESSRKIAKKYNVDKSVILNILKRNMVLCRPAKCPRIYKINIDFFQKIDTQEKAYFLGILYADGNIFLGKYQHIIQIGLQEGDKELLEILSKLIYNKVVLIYVPPSPRISKTPSKAMYKLSFSGKKIAADLLDKGLVPAKSLILRFPNFNQVPEYLISHFIRGYFDGDGSIWIRKNKQHGCSITSSIFFCKSMREFLAKKLNINILIKKSHRSNNITHDIIINGNCQVTKFLDWLYKDSTIFLNRKHKKYLSLKNNEY